MTIRRAGDFQVRCLVYFDDATGEIVWAVPDRDEMARSRIAGYRDPVTGNETFAKRVETAPESERPVSSRDTLLDYYKICLRGTLRDYCEICRGPCLRRPRHGENNL